RNVTGVQTCALPISGASSGIGEATVRNLCGQGMAVIAVARREERLRPLAEETGCEYVTADLATPAGAEALRDAVGERPLAAVVEIGRASCRERGRRR